MTCCVTFSIQISAALDNFKEKALHQLRSFYCNLHYELVKVSLSQDTLSRVAQQLMASATSRVSTYNVLPLNIHLLYYYFLNKLK